MVTNMQENSLESLAEPIAKFMPRGLCNSRKSGRCFATSISFAKLCKNKYGINVEALRFSEKSNMDHFVDVYGDIIIDWTPRQCEGCEDAPIPLISRLGKDNVYGGIVYRNDDELELSKIKYLGEK